MNVCRLPITQRRRHDEHSVCGGHYLGGKPSEAAGDEHTVAERGTGDTLTEFGEDADGLAAGHERQRRFDLVEPLHDERVDEVHTCRGDTHAHLARNEFGRRTLLDSELIERGE